MKYISKLAGKRVVIVGGTSGIGFGTAEACIEYGAIVTVASSQQAKIDKTIQRIKTSYPDAAERISGHVCDLSSPDLEANIKALLDFATANGEYKLDHVVSTAGDSYGLTTLADATAEKIQAHGQVRFVGSVLLAKVAMQYLNKSNTSSYTMTSGVKATKPSAGWSILAGWGAANEGLTRGLAIDMAPVRVNCVAPGAVDTELFDSFGEGRRQGIVDFYKSASLTRSVASPEDIAESYTYLMKDTFVTGTVLHSDGGHTLI